MKSIILALATIMTTALASAQDTKDIVRWSAGVSTTAEATFVIIGADIAKNWHIFTSMPGGDGFAIPTSIVVVNDKDSMVITDRMANMKMISKDFEGMGTMNYFEGKLSYKILLTKPLSKDAKVYITYQCCNDKMCLSPTDMELPLQQK